MPKPQSEEARTVGWGAAAPSNPLPNEKLEALIDTTDEWIQKNIGIKNRLIINETENTINMGVEASLKAIDAAAKELQLDASKIKDKIRVLVCATNSPPELYPASGIQVQKELGLSDCFAFDVQAGCTGWLYSLSIGRNYMQNLQEDEYVLVLGTDALSTEMDYHERIGIIFGDGAGATLLGRGDSKRRIIDVHLGSQYSESLYLKTGYARNVNNPSIYENGGRPEGTENHPQMNGKAIMKLTLEKVKASIDTLLERNSVQPSDIDYFVPHQTNINIVKNLCNHVGFAFEDVPFTLDERGSISTAGLPTHIVSLQNEKSIEPGSMLLLCAYGAGFTFGSALLAY